MADCCLFDMPRWSSYTDPLCRTQLRRGEALLLVSNITLNVPEIVEADRLQTILQNWVRALQFGVYPFNCLGASPDGNHLFVDLGGVKSPCARPSRLDVLDGRLRHPGMSSGGLQIANRGQLYNHESLKNSLLAVLGMPLIMETDSMRCR